MAALLLQLGHLVAALKMDMSDLLKERVNSDRHLQIVTDASHEEISSISGFMVVMGTVLVDWICRRQKTTITCGSIPIRRGRQPFARSSSSPRTAKPCFIVR